MLVRELMLIGIDRIQRSDYYLYRYTCKTCKDYYMTN